MPLAASISETRGPTPLTYITGVSRLGTLWMLNGACAKGQTHESGRSRIRLRRVCLYAAENLRAGGAEMHELNRRSFLRVTGAVSAATLLGAKVHALDFRKRFWEADGRE